MIDNAYTQAYHKQSSSVRFRSSIMQEWLDNKRKNGCQIEFDDTDGQQVYKSLYLDTLGADAR